MLYSTSIGQGPLVVLLHGMSLSSHTWRHVIPSLSSSHCVHAIDLPGLGKSYRQDKADWSWEIATESLRLTVEPILDQPFTLVGHSIGGLFACWLASEASGIGERVSKLVLINGATTEFKPAWPAKSLSIPWIPSVLARVIGSHSLYAMGLRSTYAGHDTTQDSREAIRVYSSLAKQSGAIRTQGQIIRKLRKLDARMIEDMNRTIACPVHALHSRGDRVVPLDVSQRFCTLVPQAELTIFESSSHVPQETHPEQTLRFLKACL